jgi:hypothetical protein
MKRAGRFLAVAVGLILLSAAASLLWYSLPLLVPPPSDRYVTVGISVWLLWRPLVGLVLLTGAVLVLWHAARAGTR